MSITCWQNDARPTGSSAMMAQTVFVIDNDADALTRVARVLIASGFVVQPYGSAEQFLEQEPEDRPGCVVSDVRLPGRDGLDLFATLQTSGRFTPMIFMTAYADVPSSVLAMKKGAVDFLIKPVSDDALLEAVRLALALDLDLRSRHRDLEEIRTRYSALTRREAEVFWLVVRGLLNKQIARDLRISEQTVKVHRRRVMQKMHAESLAALVHQAERLDAHVPPPGSEGDTQRRAG